MTVNTVLVSPAGFLLDFISFPVIKGFTCAAAVTIGFGQVKVSLSNTHTHARGKTHIWPLLFVRLFQNLLGLNGIPSEFVLEVYYTFYRIPEARIGDVILGLLCVFLLVLLVFMKTNLGPDDPPDSKYKRVSRKLVWTVATSQYLFERDWVHMSEECKCIS